MREVSCSALLRGSRNRSAAVSFVVACLLCAGVVRAQTMPFQSSMRSTVGTGLGQQPMARGGTFIPRVDSAIQYVDNLNLAQDRKDIVSTWGLEAAPGVYASYLSSTVTAAIDYAVVGRVWGDSDYNDVSQRGMANGRWTAVPDLFYIDALASITDDVINVADGIDYGGLGIFGQDNLSQQATASIRPTIDKQFGDYSFLAQYAYGRVWYFDQGSDVNQIGFIGQDNSRDQNAYVAFGNTGSERKLTGQVFYNWQKTDFDNALPYNYEQLGMDLRWQFRPSMALTGQFGAESDLAESTTQGGLDSNFWSVGLRWEPDSRTYAEARYGDRFFGHTYFLAIGRTTRMFEFEASYDESPEVDTQILSLGDFTPGELPPSVPPGTDFGRLNSDPYVAKNATVGVTAVGSRTRVSLQGFQFVRDYIRDPRYQPQTFRANETDTGGVFSVTRQLASNLSADFYTSYTNSEQTQLFFEGGVAFAAPYNYNDTQVIARLNRESLGGKIIASAEAGYLNRSGSEDYDGWWAGMRVRWYP